MRKIILLLALIAGSEMHAQTYLKGGMKEVLASDWKLSGCNFASYFTVYDYLHKKGMTQQTAAPKGYEPFYISTFARHGSRWLGEAWEYDNPLNVVKKGEEKGVLTAKGKQLLAELKELRSYCPNEKFGALTNIGAEQHRDIARRMCKNFPEIFNKSGVFYAQSSVVKRCVKSMNAEAEIIDHVIGRHITQEHGKKGMQDRLAGHYTNKTIESWRSKGYSLHSKEMQTMVPYKRLCNEVFTDTSWSTEKEMRNFVRLLFDLAQSIQNHDFKIDLWKYYTADEIDALWQMKSRHWYRMFGPSPTTGNMSPMRSKWQMEDIIAGADSVVNRKEWHGANLRFSHDTSLMPLICLMELGTSGKQVSESELGSLGTFWRNQEMFPMAGNIQLVFYRPTNGNGDILVKAMLNEVEMTLPCKAVTGPYYKWTDVRNHWKNRISE